MIEEIYSVKFMKDTTLLTNRNARKSIKQSSFPEFVVDFMVSKYNKKAMSDQNGIDLIFSVDKYYQTNKSVEIFHK